MKYAMIIPDGCADEPQASLGGRTPLQAAHTPHMDAVARAGIVGRADHVPVSMPSGSDVGTMSLFGYDPAVCHRGRAPLEAAAQGIALAANDWAVRCNLVTIEDGVMRSFTAGQIPNDLARQLIGLMQQEHRGGPLWEFHPGVSYRNLLIFRARDGIAPFNSETRTVPPHDVTDQPIADHLPRGPGADELLELMARSAELFAASAENQSRRAQGRLPATQIWLWGQGQRPELDPFEKKYGVRAAVITAVDLLRGLGKLLGSKIVEVPGATGYLDTNYAGKAQAAIRALDEVDLVAVHVEATDEASHEGDAAAKVAALEAIDRDIVGPLHAHLRTRGEHRLLVCPDHPTFLRTKTHSHGYVPFAMCGTGVDPDEADRYDEATAAEQGSVTLDRGYELMAKLLS